MDGSVSMALILILLLSLAIHDKFYDVLRADYSTRKPLDVDTLRPPLSSAKQLHSALLSSERASGDFLMK